MTWCFIFLKGGINITASETNVLFSGGAGMFIEYHDIVKPAKLYAIVKMIIDNDASGLPIEIIKDMNILSLLEWYINRRYVNPLKQLDYQDIADTDELDIFLDQYMQNDPSIYKLSPMTNIDRILDVYRREDMSFPVYIYSEADDDGIRNDVNHCFQGINFEYVHGDLEQCLEKCGENFTYIFSDIEKLGIAYQTMKSHCCVFMLARDYRYNYLDNHKTLKCDLQPESDAADHIKINTISVYDNINLARSFENIIRGG